MTWKEVRARYIEELQRIYGNAESAAIFDLVFEKVCNTSRTSFAEFRNKQVNDETKNSLAGYLHRLSSQEPVQYVLGSTWFCGLEFSVGPGVLIPRPETEELVEWVIANCRFPVHELAILDVGTGSGCIAITLKRRIRKAAVTAIDISEDALKIANKNAMDLGVDVNFLALDFLDEIARDRLGKFDIIVSNPPYIPRKDRSTLAKNVENFEPSLALFVEDNDPHIFYHTLAAFGKQHLNENGVIYAEMPHDTAEVTGELFKLAGYETETRKDMQGQDRMIRAFWS